MFSANVPGNLLSLAGKGENLLSPFTNHAAISQAAQPSGVFSVSAQATTTQTVAATVASTVTNAITGTVLAQTTPLPLPPQNSGGLRLNPLNWNYLTEVPHPALGPFGWLYVVLMLGLFAGAAYLYFVKRSEWKRTNPVLKRATDRFATAAMWVAGLALVFAFFRAIGLDFLNLRFWFYLWLIAAVAVAGWFYYWFRNSYPKEMARYQKTQRARQYMPGVARKSGGASRPIASNTDAGKAATKPVPGSATTPAGDAAPIRTRPNTDKKRRKRK